MGLFDKMKKILFDEEIDEETKSSKIPENNVEKKPTMKRNQGGFIDYHHSDDTTDLKEVVETVKKEPEVIEEEDTIKEIIIPKEEKKTFNFPIDDPNDEIMTKTPTRSEIHANEERVATTSRSTVNDLLRNMNKSTPVSEEKEQIIEREVEYKSTKKPFRVTPVISPVYGIIGDYPEEEEEVKVTEHIKVKETKVNIKRSFGPVSYNDKPLPKKEIKKDIAELNKSISDLANGKDEEIVIPTKKKVIEEELQDDDIIQTDNYDEYPDIYSDSIKNEKNENTSIEDALESTNELDVINNQDEEFEENMEEEIVEDNELEDEEVEDISENDISEEENPTKDLDEVLNSEIPEEEIVEDEDAHLDDTIETDLFNLIDSMYKDDDEEKDE